MPQAWIRTTLSACLVATLALTTQVLSLAQDAEEDTQNVCQGSCFGLSLGAARANTTCNNLTAAQIQQFTQQACDDNDPAEARTNANSMCLERDETGTCLCTGGTLSENSDPPKSTATGGCLFLCWLSYDNGTCNPVAAPD